MEFASRHSREVGISWNDQVQKRQNLPRIHISVTVERFKQTKLSGSKQILARIWFAPHFGELGANTQ
jgi:hypothetical protein